MELRVLAADEVVKADPCALEFVDPSDGGHDAKVADDWMLTLRAKWVGTQRTQYTLIKEYTLNYRGLNIMI